MIEWYQNFFVAKKTPTDSLLLEGQRRLADALERRDKALESKALQELGMLHLAHQQLYDTAMGYFIQALVIQDSLNLINDQVFTYVGIAQIFEEIHDYDKSATALE